MPAIEIRQRPSVFAEPPDDVKALLIQSASADLSVARPARAEMAQAIQQVLREGILAGNVLFDIYAPYVLGKNQAPEFVLDVLAPGVEKSHIAYTIPGYGRIPERCIEGDYIMVPTFEVGSSIDWPLKMVRDARTDIVNRALEIFEAGFVKKMNNDGWHTLLAAGADRNLVVYDSNAGAGRFTLRLITLMQQAMRRNAGGNTTSLFHGRLTDLFLSIEALEDMRNWTVAEVDSVTRREIITSAEGFINRIFNVNLHELYEFGVSQEYQNFYTDSAALNASLAPADVELVVGLDLQRQDAFVHPIRQPLEVFEDDTMHRSRRAGVYGWQEHGFAVVDNRRIILGSL